MRKLILDLRKMRSKCNKIRRTLNSSGVRWLLVLTDENFFFDKNFWIYCSKTKTLVHVMRFYSNAPEYSKEESNLQKPSWKLKISRILGSPPFPPPRFVNGDKYLLQWISGANFNCYRFASGQALVHGSRHIDEDGTVTHTGTPQFQLRDRVQPEHQGYDPRALSRPSTSLHLPRTGLGFPRRIGPDVRNPGAAIQ